MLARRDRTAVDGAKTLFLEEVQSDWHQQGKKYGYQSPDNVEYAMGLGESLVELKQYKEASFWFQRVLPFYQNNDAILMHAG
ncbi:MAG TPA: hypothetical protein VNO32_47495 [Candidatus Acidoferrum sp.]|nr:hypothetical protein [Candidatus Acidoferrum sp.]